MSAAPAAVGAAAVVTDAVAAAAAAADDGGNINADADADGENEEDADAARADDLASDADAGVSAPATSAVCAVGTGRTIADGCRNRKQLRGNIECHNVGRRQFRNLHEVSHRNVLTRVEKTDG